MRVGQSLCYNLMSPSITDVDRILSSLSAFVRLPICSGVDVQASQPALSVCPCVDADATRANEWQSALLRFVSTNELLSRVVWNEPFIERLPVEDVIWLLFEWQMWEDTRMNKEVRRRLITRQ